MSSLMLKNSDGDCLLAVELEFLKTEWANHQQVLKCQKAWDTKRDSENWIFHLILGNEPSQNGSETMHNLQSSPQ